MEEHRSAKREADEGVSTTPAKRTRKDKGRVGAGAERQDPEATEPASFVPHESSKTPIERHGGDAKVKHGPDVDPEEELMRALEEDLEATGAKNGRDGSVKGLVALLEGADDDDNYDESEDEEDDDCDAKA